MTGASGAIGGAVARALARDGYSVLAHFNSNYNAAIALKDALESQGTDCLLIGADLGAQRGVHIVSRSVKRRLHLDPEASLKVIVNSAAHLQGPAFKDLTASGFNRVLDLNARAPILLAQRLLPHMSRGASITNISSASAHIGNSGDILYALSKAALESATRNLALLLGPQGIRVNAVVPGYTDNGHALFSDPVAREYMSSMSVLGDVSSPDDVAAAVSYLVSPNAQRTTGAVLDVSAGMTLHPRPTASPSVRSIRPD